MVEGVRSLRTEQPNTSGGDVAELPILTGWLIEAREDARYGNRWAAALWAIGAWNMEYAVTHGDRSHWWLLTLPAYAWLVVLHIAAWRRHR